MTMMESTTTIDLTETTTPPPTSIEEIHIETIEERLHISNLVCYCFFHFPLSIIFVFLIPFSVCVFSASEIIQSRIRKRFSICGLI